MKRKETDCYIDIWKEADFRGERLRVYGPAEYPNMQQFAQGDWGDQVGSLRVGPHAFVMAYRDRDFKDKMITFGPNDEVARLEELKFEDDMESVKVIDSMKIFDELLGRVEPPASPPPADKSVERKAKKNRHKGRHR